MGHFAPMGCPRRAARGWSPEGTPEAGDGQACMCRKTGQRGDPRGSVTKCGKGNKPTVFWTHVKQSRLPRQIHRDGRGVQLEPRLM